MFQKKSREEKDETVVKRWVIKWYEKDARGKLHKRQVRFRGTANQAHEKVYDLKGCGATGVTIDHLI